MHNGDGDVIYIYIYPLVVWFAKGKRSIFKVNYTWTMFNSYVESPESPAGIFGFVTNDETNGNVGFTLVMHGDGWQ